MNFEKYLDAKIEAQPLQTETVNLTEPIYKWIEIGDVVFEQYYIFQKNDVNRKYQMYESINRKADKITFKSLLNNNINPVLTIKITNKTLKGYIGYIKNNYKKIKSKESIYVNHSYTLLPTLLRYVIFDTNEPNAPIDLRALGYPASTFPENRAWMFGMDNNATIIQSRLFGNHSTFVYNTDVNTNYRYQKWAFTDITPALPKNLKSYLIGPKKGSKIPWKEWRL